jgi:hypothetical protein
MKNEYDEYIKGENKNTTNNTNTETDSALQESQSLIFQ